MSTGSRSPATPSSDSSSRGILASCASSRAPNGADASPWRRPSVYSASNRQRHAPTGSSDAVAPNVCGSGTAPQGMGQRAEAVAPKGPRRSSPSSTGSSHVHRAWRLHRPAPLPAPALQLQGPPSGPRSRVAGIRVIRERATGVEPATSSLGSFLGPCGARVFRRRQFHRLPVVGRAARPARVSPAQTRCAPPGEGWKLDLPQVEARSERRHERCREAS